MASEFLFRSQPYLRETDARIIALDENGGIELDRTIFYAQSGGQPGDKGVLQTEDGQQIPITNTVHPGNKTTILHLSEPGDWHLASGDMLRCKIDWERRLKLMRMHSALHLLSVVFPFPVTGGSIGEEKGRLDFDMPEVPENLVKIEAELDEMISGDYPISEEWISETELKANPELVKTMKVKPPMGQGRVRLIRIGQGNNSIDLQPCGGTHVAATGEIGPVTLGKIQNKGKQNRRVYLHFAQG